MSVSSSGAGPVNAAGRQETTGSVFRDAAESSLNLSFCGCGFLGLYHLGVATKFAQRGRRFLSRVDRYTGASAGSLIACLLGIIGPDLRTIDVSTEPSRECIHLQSHLANSVSCSNKSSDCHSGPLLRYKSHNISPRIPCYNYTIIKACASICTIDSLHKIHFMQ